MNKKKNILSRVLHNSKVLTLLGLAVIVLLSFPVAKNISQRHSANKEIEELEKEIKLVENKNTQLQKMINFLNSDQYVEEQARLNFGLKKAGEQAVVVDANGDPSAYAGAGAQANSDNKKNSQTIYNIFGLNKIKSKKIAGNGERWKKYFFGE